MKAKNVTPPMVHVIQLELTEDELKAIAVEGAAIAEKSKYTVVDTRNIRRLISYLMTTVYPVPLDEEDEEDDDE